MLKIEIKGDNKDKDVKTQTELNEFFKAQIKKIDKIINDSSRKYNARKAYFKLIEAEGK